MSLYPLTGKVRERVRWDLNYAKFKCITCILGMPVGQPQPSFHSKDQVKDGDLTAGVSDYSTRIW